MTDLPRVSVLIPSYNHAGYIAAAIQSVIDQTYPAWEVIVVDDCSSDESPDIARAFSDPRITVLVNDRNLGINGTLARALAVSTGDYVSVLASDDLLLPRKLERQVALLRRTGSQIVYANGDRIYDDGRRSPVDLSPFIRDVEAGRALARIYTDDTSLPLLQSALFERDAFVALSIYREQVKLDDWITLIKSFELYTVEFIPEPVFLYRQHETNTFRRYEHTLGLRLEIIAKAIPADFRRPALAALFSSQSNYLAWDGHWRDAIQFAVASQALVPNAGRLMTFARAIAYRLRHRHRTRA